MDQFVIFNKNNYLYALCINKNPIHVFLINKYITLKHYDTLYVHKGKNYFKLMHKKYYENMREELIKKDNIQEIKDYLKDIITYYQNEITNTMNLLD
tara:strand:- start:196 stop:486 length:291 start_codon:yes stop_codon:yes gene_type:complete